MIKANDPSLKSWIEVPSNSDFPIQNLPFGIFKTQSSNSRVGIAIGDQVLDLSVLNKLGFLDDFKIDLESDATMLSDIALSKFIKGETVKVVDEYNNTYQPIFTVKFKKD